MPAKSKAQYRFMRAVMGGAIHPPGLSKKEASEFVAHVKPSKLPERKKKRK